jgi:hypothetical protein
MQGSVIAMPDCHDKPSAPVFLREGDMPKKRGDRAFRTAEKRARRERRQLAREEKLRKGGSATTMAPRSTSGRSAHLWIGTSAR